MGKLNYLGPFGHEGYACNVHQKRNWNYVKTSTMKLDMFLSIAMAESCCTATYPEPAALSNILTLLRKA